MKTIYQTKVSVSGGRDGKVVSQDGVLNFEVRIPKEMGGAGGAYTNPEQLFAAGYAACFDSALNLVARQNKVIVTESKVTATVGLAFNEESGFTIQAKLQVELPGLAKKVALDLLDKAHAVCPYSKATRNNVDVEMELV